MHMRRAVTAADICFLLGSYVDRKNLRLRMSRSQVEVKVIFRGGFKVFSLLYLSPLGWHTLPSHANAEAYLIGWPNA